LLLFCTEKFSTFAVCLIYLKVFLILPLAKQLNFFPIHLIISDQMKFPKYGIWNILGFMTMTIGSVLFNTGLQGEHGAGGTYLDNLKNYLANLFSASSQSLYWCIFSIVIQVWCETIIKGQSHQDIIKDSKIFCRNYRQLTAALENYFFYSFALFQIVSIATLFLTCSKLILQNNFNTNNLFLLIGPCLSLGSFTIHILSLVFTVEGLYDHTAQLEMRVRSALGGSSKKEKRQKLKQQLLELSSQKPLTAKGYFTISKETLTSMLSVSITYLIILVQFQVSS